MSKVSEINLSLKNLLKKCGSAEIVKTLSYSENYQLAAHYELFFDGLKNLEQTPREASKYFSKALQVNPDNKIYLHFYLRSLAYFYDAIEFKEFTKKITINGNKLSKESTCLTNYIHCSLDSMSVPQIVSIDIAARFNEKKLFSIMQQAKMLLLLYPKSSFVHNAIGSSELQLGNRTTAEAFFARAIKLNPHDFDASVNLARSCAYRSDHIRCIELLKNANSIKSLPVNLIALLANQFEQLGQLDAAVLEYQKIYKHNKTNLETLIKLGNLSIKLNQLNDAKHYLTLALNLDGSNLAALNGLGMISHQKNNYDCAIEFFHKALCGTGSKHQVHNNLGLAYTSAGVFNLASEQFAKAITLQPNFATAHRNLSHITAYKSLSNNHVRQMELTLEKPDLTTQQRCELNFAIAKAYNDIGEVELAYKKYILANKIRKKILDYKVEADLASIKFFKSISSPQTEVQIEDISKQSSSNLIFIIGMPRSGTTLLQRILSGHSQVTSVGEVPYLERAFNANIGWNNSLTPDGIRNFREHYLLLMQQHFSTKKYVIDKTPQNFIFTNLIRFAFPNAKVIHIYRDPNATCWSNFTHYFPSPSMSYSFDLNDIEAYYRAYHDLMSDCFIKDKEFLINCNYENLTKETTYTVKRLLSALELKYEAACERPERVSTLINTASNIQARQPIFQNSSQEWKKFKHFLHGNFENLPTF